jgi:hypothetical protein
MQTDELKRRQEFVGEHYRDLESRLTTWGREFREELDAILAKHRQLERTVNIAVIGFIIVVIVAQWRGLI